MLLYTLRQLEYALAVAEQGSIAAAAHKLGIAQPSLSAAIIKLEAQLRLQIFLRHHAQGVTPTAAGARFLADARSLVAQAQDVQRSAESAGTEIAGELTLGCFVTIAPVYVPRLFAGFRSLYPKAQLRLQEGFQDVLFDGLRSGRFDLALLYRLEMPGDITATELAGVWPSVLLPTNHRLARRRKVSLHDLKDEPLILLDIPPSRSYFTGIIEQQGLTANIAFSSPSLELVRGMVGQGLGYSLLVTRPHGDHTYDGQPIAVRPIAEPQAPSMISLASLKSSRPTRLISAFAQYCEQFFARLDGRIAP